MRRAHLAPHGLQRDERGEEAAALAPERVRVHWLRPRARRRDEGGQLEEGRATARARLESLARGAAHELVKGLAHLGRVRGLGVGWGGGGPQSVRWRRA